MAGRSDLASPWHDLDRVDSAAPARLNHTSDTSPMRRARLHLCPMPPTYFARMAAITPLTVSDFWCASMGEYRPCFA